MTGSLWLELMKLVGETNMKFEELIKNIEDITKKIESGSIGLDESIELYDKAMKDCKECYNMLNNAKGKIEILNKEFAELKAQENKITSTEPNVEEVESDEDK